MANKKTTPTPPIQAVKTPARTRRPRPAALGFLLWCTVIAVTAWTLVQKHGDTGQH